MSEPYRTNAPPPPCPHTKTFRQKVLKGGEGPDDAAEEWGCVCGAYAWKYCDGTMSDWKLSPGRDGTTGKG